MPIYRYRCENCGFEFTVLEPPNHHALRTCERCGQRAAQRVFSRVGVIYRGSGFHSTDYRRSSSSRSHPKEGQDREGTPADTTREGKS